MLALKNCYKQQKNKMRTNFHIDQIKKKKTTATIEQNCKHGKYFI